MLVELNYKEIENLYFSIEICLDDGTENEEDFNTLLAMHKKFKKLLHKAEQEIIIANRKAEIQRKLDKQLNKKLLKRQQSQ